MNKYIIIYFKVASNFGAKFCQLKIVVLYHKPFYTNTDKENWYQVQHIMTLGE